MTEMDVKKGKGVTRRGGNENEMEKTRGILYRKGPRKKRWNLKETKREKKKKENRGR